MSTKPHSDVFRVMPELGVIAERVGRGEYEDVAGALLALHDRDPRLLAEAGPLLADVPGFHDLVEVRARFAADDVLALALLAESHVRSASVARGGLPASKMTDEQVGQYLSHLRSADRILVELCAVEPAWTYPWHLRVVTSRMLELGSSETRRRYDRLAETDPAHHPAQLEMLQQLCPKWVGGTWDEATGFAREVAAAAPPGSPAHGIVADLHLERWGELAAREQQGYLRDDTVLVELAAVAEASVWHPAYRAGFGWVRLHTTLGSLFALAGHKDAAARHFAALGDVVDPHVWAYLGKDAGTVLRARKAGAKLGAVVMP